MLTPQKSLAYIESMTFDQKEIEQKTQEIYNAAASTSKQLQTPNFEVIHHDDLRVIFELYDSLFFANHARKLLASTPLNFALSKRMVRSGGMTKRFKDRRTGAIHFEISVATTILFHCFEEEPHRPIRACGIECRDRLEALQRIMEHEMVHLIEMLLWEKSSCSQKRFQSIAHRFFGHTEHEHDLITPFERAKVKYGIQPGMEVSFTMEGQLYHGVVNRITKRATVLVEDSTGRRYTNGKHYAKFYVPISLLTPR